ncbi:MAG: amine dehydrogenase large subunit [Sedimentitalea sp.]|uniref:amine dehydrogenase large subunit n=1 Tax=Sedimentitalea sp. TaxID=2048915 RepID=UPI0032640D7D
MKNNAITALSLLSVLGGQAVAQEVDLQPETLIVEERISEGEHVYVMDMGISGPSSIMVLNADDLSLEGNIGAGNFSQMLMSPDKSSIYTSSVFMTRYTYGDVEAVIGEWDSQALTGKREIIVSNKLAQTLSQKGALNLSADGDYLVVQNATPATSVSIVSLTENKEVVEIPTPGCWTAYPALDSSAFSTLCGDGTVVKYTYSADGGFGDPARSDKIFDPDANPVFGNAVRVGGNLVYVSYAGALLVVDDSGDVPTLTNTIEFAEEGWAPSGYNLMGYHEPSQTLFITMHSNPFDGSHKLPAEEIWAINMESGTVTGRSEAHGEGNITVSGGEVPTVFGVDHLGGMHRYEVTLGDTVSLTQAAEREGVVFFATILATDY